jgi:hypothetical protein
MYSKGVDPAGKTYDAKMVNVHKDKDTRVFTMSMNSEETRGEYIKIMEISYVKRPDQGVKEQRSSSKNSSAAWMTRSRSRSSAIR